MVESKPGLKVKCPTCKKEVDWKENPYKPFCSKRCSTTDLGNWADNKYLFESQEESPSENE